MTKEIKKWWEKVSEYYQKESKIPTHSAHYGPSTPYENKLKLLGKIKGKHILELGCGGAQCSIAFAKQGAKCTGIDISREQLNYAKALAKKNKVNIKLIQGTFQNLSKIKSRSQDIVFSSFALQYSPNLKKTLKEVKRVLKKNGLFIFSFDHPFYRTINPKTLRVKESYFKTGKKVEKQGKNKFVMYNHTISEIYNLLTQNNFFVEKIIEPDSRKRYPHDLWYGLWDYTPKLLKNFPPTIIFKCKKRK